MGWARMRQDKERGKRARRIPKIAGDRKSVRKAAAASYGLDPMRTSLGVVYTPISKKGKSNTIIDLAAKF